MVCCGPVGAVIQAEEGGTVQAGGAQGHRGIAQAASAVQAVCVPYRLLV